MRLGGVEVADMLRDEGLAPARDRHSGLQMAAERQHGGTVRAPARSARGTKPRARRR